MAPDSSPTDRGERLVTVGFAISIAIIGLVGLGLLVSVDHSSVGATGRAPVPSSGRAPKLESPQIDSGFPSVELQNHPREPVSSAPGISAARNAVQCSRLEDEMAELNARSQLSHASAESSRLAERLYRLRNEAINVGCAGR
jgi:hypothetical protein